MKTYSIFLLVVLLFCLGCKDQQNKVIAPEEVIGSWRADSLIFKSVEDGDQLVWDAGSILTILADSSYYKNFVSGSWELVDDELILKPREDLGAETHYFRIEKISEEEMTLQIEMTEGEYCCDFEEFTSEEQLLITESFRRDEQQYE